MLFPDVARHHAVLLLETFGEVAGSCEANIIGHLADALVGVHRGTVPLCTQRIANHYI